MCIDHPKLTTIIHLHGRSKRSVVSIQSVFKNLRSGDSPVISLLLFELKWCTCTTGSIHFRGCKGKFDKLRIKQWYFLYEDMPRLNIYSQVNLALNLYRTYWTGILNQSYFPNHAVFSLSWWMLKITEMRNAGSCKTLNLTTIKRHKSDWWTIFFFYLV